VLTCAALLCAAPDAEAADEPVATIAVKSMVLRSNTTVRRDVRTARISGLVVRARGDFCKGYPKLSVGFDGRPSQTLRLTRQWRDFKLALKLKAGRHLARIAFANDRTVRGKCSRAVRISEVRLVAGATRRVPLGTALTWATVQSDSQYAAAALREYDSFTPENEMKMDVVEPEPGRFAFATADALVDWALAHGKEVRGHALVFDQQTPAWVGRSLDPNHVSGAMRDYIQAVMTRYRGRVKDWDVVNEAFEENGAYRHTFWYQRLGPRYVELAYEFARAADPTAKLYFNEYNAERPGRKRDSVVDLVRRLKQRGLIDGVGLQMHTELGQEPTQAQIEDTMRLYESLGLSVQITEMDVRARREGDPATLTDRLAWQADAYGAAARACEAVAACARFTVWGVSDGFSWRGADEMPLLLDGAFRPKPALAAVQDALGH
jgi:endo-1,4-beta-xylanase